MIQWLRDLRLRIDGIQGYDSAGNHFKLCFGAAMNEIVCPECKIAMEQIEKSTFTGRDIREFQCPECKRTEIIDFGNALWKVLSDANRSPEDDEKM